PPKMQTAPHTVTPPPPFIPCLRCTLPTDMISYFLFCSLFLRSAHSVGPRCLRCESKQQQQLQHLFTESYSRFDSAFSYLLCETFDCVLLYLRSSAVEIHRTPCMPIHQTPQCDRTWSTKDCLILDTFTPPPSPPSNNTAPPYPPSPCPN